MLTVKKKKRKNCAKISVTHAKANDPGRTFLLYSYPPGSDSGIQVPSI